jgi:hypothetical protein
MTTFHSRFCKLPLRSEKDLKYSFRAGPFHCIDAIGKRIFFTYQTVNIYGAFLQQVDGG